jgi:exodeoxyribonuclease VIII
MFEPQEWPSVEYDLAESVYHSLNYMSASRLKVLSSGTSLHLDHEIRNPREDSDDLMIGRALHTFVLRRLAFDSEFAVMPKVDGRTKEGKAAKEQFALEAAGKSVLTTDQAAQVEAMALSIAAHPEAYNLLRNLPGREEVSVFAEIYGIQSKSRMDRILDIDGSRVICDLKTVRDGAGRRDFERTVWTYNYGLQALMYSRMANAAGLGPISDFVFVAVEKKAPYAVACYRLRDEVLQAFGPRLDSLIAKYNDYLEAGPVGYTGIEDLAVPAWALRELESEIGESNV